MISEKITDEEYEHRKEFAKKMAEYGFTVEELAMIMWKYECCFCEARDNCYGDKDCVAWIYTKACHNFDGKYDFDKHEEIGKGGEGE